MSASSERGLSHDLVADAEGEPISLVVRRRWAQERPFEGMSTPVLQRKLRKGALSLPIADMVRRELAMRGEIEGWD